MTNESDLPYKLNVTKAVHSYTVTVKWQIECTALTYIQFVWETTFDGHFGHEDIDIWKNFYHFSRATGYQLSTVQI